MHISHEPCMAFDINDEELHHMKLCQLYTLHSIFALQLNNATSVAMHVYVSCFMLIGLHLLLIITLLSYFPAGKYSPCTTTEVSNCTLIMFRLMYVTITCLQRFQQYYVDIQYLPVYSIKPAVGGGRK